MMDHNGWLEVELHQITDYLYLTDLVGVSTREGHKMMKRREVGSSEWVSS